MFSKTVLIIRGIAIQIRPLPSGDLAVWHPCNEDVRAVIEPICRNRGHWKAEYNNWIIFRQFENVVCAELAVAANQ